MEQGDTLVETPETFRGEDFRERWTHPASHCCLARDGAGILGGYLIKPAQSGRGSHVGNGTYVVDPAARGRGVGRALGEHSLIAARELGYQALQFNFVVSVNEPAVRLWKSLGFTIRGTLPQAFRHPQAGLVDAYVMHRFL